MAEVKLRGSLYKVTLTEYDAGAQRPWGEKFFDSKVEAEAYCRNYNIENKGIPEWFVRADYHKVA